MKTRNPRTTKLEFLGFSGNIPMSVPAESKILKFLGLCGIHSREPGSVVCLSAFEIRGGVSWSEEHLRRREL
ncbi:hypothetical protein HID58_083019 [Brassica napus]|uniref:Uncharacterized protein n=1 Tax=Brassica napus TaxID=3708 RepID=A0ABQ7YC97_BRANA|nr:hypothetical protein HID58_083019 [Brassica napus]